MRQVSVIIAALIALSAVPSSLAQSCSALYGQCGGINWTGATCCSSGVCTVLNPYYSQCLPGSAGSTSTTTRATSATTTTTRATTTTTTTTTRATTTTTRATTTTTTTTTARATTTTTQGGNSPTFTPVAGGLSGTAKTTRYWDCCKPSCSWPSNAGTVSPHAPNSCSKSGSALTDGNVRNVCGGGGSVGTIDDGYSYMCTSNQPTVINDNLSYGFAATSFSLSSKCCSCFLLTFTSAPLVGKQLVVQMTNSGGDLGANQFDLQIPGGGLGIFDGCSQQFNVDANTWGQRYGGVASLADCSKLPAALQAGCKWRFGWFMGADNPAATFQEIKCPAELTALSGCARA
ncbi:RlpA-like double-psi beta-barrel-protein domain-containing protein-containing protein [Cladochytrium replicatum]|nr:RlpA-like double-psi beta-barrel-protein domain-containing protein-containing protein [Cladochytrium replicatum]